jgi:hypothetical protein
VNGIAKRERPLFQTAAADWFASKSSLSPLGARYYRQYFAKLSRHCNRLITHITANDIAELQTKRQS